MPFPFLRSLLESSRRFVESAIETLRSHPSIRTLREDAFLGPRCTLGSELSWRCNLLFELRVGPKENGTRPAQPTKRSRQDRAFFHSLIHHSFIAGRPGSSRLRKLRGRDFPPQALRRLRLEEL